MAWRPRDRAAFAHALLAALPLGEVWPRAIGTVIVNVVTALAGASWRFAERAGYFLLIEALPPQSYHLLPDWERVLGLPEPCFPSALTIEDRRLQVREKLARRPGGQSRAYFTGIAARLGYHEYGPPISQLPVDLPIQTGRLRQISIEEHRPFMFGVSRLGDPRWQFAPHKMRFVWTVSVPGSRLTWFRFGGNGGRLGQDPHLGIARATDLECILQKYKPAQTRLIFAYTGT